MKRMFLISTDHLEKALWFRDDDDFRVAMNYVAIQAAIHPEVAVIAFILMSNHVHFLLEGDKVDCIEFVNGFKQRYAMYYRCRYGVEEFLRHNRLDVELIPYEETNGVENVVSYIVMNAVKARICGHPSQYRWGSGGVYFNATPIGGRRIGSYSDRALKTLLHSNQTNLPDEWIVGEDGYILPVNYVKRVFVENKYKTPNRMNYFFTVSSKAPKYPDSNIPSFRDQTILAALTDLLKTKYNKTAFESLSHEEQAECLGVLRYRFSADINQIARVCGLSYEDAARRIDRLS